MTNEEAVRRFEETMGQQQLQSAKHLAGLPKIVCLCGSTRFGEAFAKANLDETLAGRIVLSIGCNMRTDAEIFGSLPQAEQDAIKVRLDALHFRKIELADEVLILNVGGYVGSSTRNEIAHARKIGKPLRWLETPQEGQVPA